MEFSKNIIAILTSIVGMLVATNAAWSEARYAHTGPTHISNVAIIDGLGNAPVASQDIVISNGKILAIGNSGTVEAPVGANKIDGTGLTAMPGLIDMHVHIKGGWANGSIPGEKYAETHDDKSVQQALSGHLYSGVTTVLDVGNPHEYIVQMRDRINSGDMFGPRTFITGGPFSQAPSGWGDEEALNEVTLVHSLDKIPAQIRKYKNDGINILKLYTGMSPHAAQFVIAEAHKQDLLVIADFWSLNMDTVIMRSTGLDGWAHSAGFDVISSENNKWMADNNRFVIVTANVGEKLSGLRIKDEGEKKLLLKNPLVMDIWGRKTVEDFYLRYPEVREGFYEGPNSFYQKNGFGEMTRFRGNFLRNIKGAYDAGVLIAGGTDAPYASLWAGESMHRELELFVMAGIPELEAIKACTHNAAKILRRENEFGSLKVGMSADILIVEGDPSKNISDSRNVRYVFLQGKQIDRDSLKLKQ